MNTTDGRTLRVLLLMLLSFILGMIAVQLLPSGLVDRVDVPHAIEAREPPRPMYAVHPPTRTQHS